MSLLLAVIIGAAWCTGVLGLGIKASSNYINDQRGGVLWALGCMALFSAGVGLVVNASVDAKDAYREHCRAAGGIPVEQRQAINCVTPDGRYLDVQ